MKIETKITPVVPLEQFADEHDLVLVITDRICDEHGMFVAYLQGIEFKTEHGWLGLWGYGKTVRDAVFHCVSQMQTRTARKQSRLPDGPRAKAFEVPRLSIHTLDLREVQAQWTSAEKEQAEARLHREPKQEDHLQGAIQDLQKVQKHLEALVVQARKMSGLTREKVMMLLVDVQKDIHVDMGYLKCIDDILMDDASSSGDQCE